MLAAIREYIFWWHFPPFLLLAAGWIFGGGYLLRRNCLNNDYNERKIRLGRACLITMLAEAAAIFAGGVIFFLFYSIATATKVRLVYVGVALGAVVSIVAVYLIFYVMLELPAKKVLKISLKPLAAVYAFSAVIIVISAWPAIAIHKTKVQKNICAMHIREISNALVNYEKGFGRPAPSLETLIEKGLIPPELLKLELLPNCDNAFIYAAASFKGEPSSEKIVLTSRKIPDLDERFVFFATQETRWCSEEEFKDLLRRSENKDIAEADNQSGD